MVDEPRDVAADVRVTAPRAVHAEHPDAPVVQIALFAGFAVLVVPNQLTRVVDDVRVLRDWLPGEDAESVNRRSLTQDLRKVSRLSHWNIKCTVHR